MSEVGRIENRLRVFIDLINERGEKLVANEAATRQAWKEFCADVRDSDFNKIFR
jgi:hypothetical protein